MKKVLPVILIFAIAPFALIAQQSSSERVMLIKLNNQFIQNWITVDSAAHNKILHRDFICVLANGMIIDRKTYLEEWVNTFAYNPAACADFTHGVNEVRIFGDCALIVGYTRYKIRSTSGAWEQRTTPYTDTYIKFEGKWLCVQAQLTPLRENDFYYTSTRNRNPGPAK